MKNIVGENPQNKQLFLQHEIVIDSIFIVAPNNLQLILNTKTICKNMKQNEYSNNQTTTCSVILYCIYIYS